MEKKDRNVMPGDSEIVTKKGFLISPPPQKRTKKPLASILNSDAGYKGEGNARADKNETRNENRNENKNEKRVENRGSRPDRPNRPQKNRPPRTDKPQNAGANGGDNTNISANGNGNGAKNDRPSRPPQKNRPQKGARPQNAQNAQGAQNGQNDRPQNRPERERGQNDGASTNMNRAGGKNFRRPEKVRPNDNRAKGTKPNARPETGANDKGARPQKQQKRLSVLSDLGFNSETFFGRSNEPQEKPEVEEKIDYSKAIPLRDQIYPPKVEKAEDAAENETEKLEIIGVRFKEAGKIYYFDPDGKTVPYGTPVIVETARGREYGYTAISNRKVPVNTVVSPLKKIIRLATPDDTERMLANKDQEKAAESVFVEKVKKLKLDMHLVGVEYTFDNTKLLFYFSAEGRVDFRELVKELASVFRTRIELRQVGVRDEAKLLGGLGVCGRPLCCKTFLGEFAQVSIKMAKDQNLSLNSSKISGTCGRLLCCLRYEDAVYQKEYERTPKVDAIVETKEGKGIVTEAFPLKGIVKVRLNDKPDTPPQSFPRDEVTVVGYAKSSKQNHDEAELKALEKE